MCVYICSFIVLHSIFQSLKLVLISQFNFLGTNVAIFVCTRKHRRRVIFSPEGAQVEFYYWNFILRFLLYEKQEKQNEHSFFAKNLSFSCGNSLQQDCQLTIGCWLSLRFEL